MARTVALGPVEYAFPSADLQRMTDSGGLFAAGDADGLRAVLRRDGFVYLGGVLGRDAVLAARSVVVDDLAHRGLLVAGREAEGLLVDPDAANLPFYEGANALTAHPAVHAGVLEGPRLRAVMEALLGGDARTLDFKWLRAAWRGFFTGVHVDSVYMSRGSPRLLTAWIPFGDTTPELGALAVLRGSHAAPGLARLRDTYGRLDVEAEPGFEGSGWFGVDPAEVRGLDAEGVTAWQTADYRAGDVVVFGMSTVHMSTANRTPAVRISCDVRWQPAGEPADERYVGDVAAKVAQRKKAGAWAKDGKGAAGGDPAAPRPAVVTMDDLKRRWGFAQ